MLKRMSGSGVAAGSLEGARSATGGEAGAATEVKRWSVGRKKEVVLRLLRGESIDAVSREVSAPIYKLEQWRERALAGVDAGLQERENDPLERQLDEANRRIGELVMEVEDSDENDLYAAMDWLLARQGGIEQKLAARHLSAGALALYDVSSSYFEGAQCPLAKLGYNRDGKLTDHVLSTHLLSRLLPRFRRGDHPWYNTPER
jgi:transposase